MTSRPFQVAEARPVPRAMGLLWGLGGICLVLITIVGTRDGLATSLFALMIAALGGVLIVARPEWGVVVLTSTFFLSYPESLQGSGRLTINNVLGLTLAGLLLMRVGIERRLDFLSSRPVQFTLLIVAAALVNTVLVDQVPDLPGYSSVPVGYVWRSQELLTRAAYLIFIVAFVRVRWQILLLVGLVIGFVLITAPSAFWHAVTAAGDAESVRALTREGARASASFGINIAKNANRLAFLCVMTIAFIGYAMPATRSRLIRWGGPPAIILLVVTILLTASRSGLLGLIALLVMFAANMGLRNPRVHVFLLALVVAGGVGLTLIPQRHLERITNFFETEQGAEGADSARSRLALLGIGAKMFADNPVLGVGIGDFRPVSALSYGNSQGSALHNSYLLTLVEGGVLLFVPYVLLFWSLWRELSKARRLSQVRTGPDLAWLVAALQTIFVLFLLFSVFADVWHEVFVYLITGLTVAVSRLYQRDVGATLA
jgi:O-antigen ligase